MRHLIVAIAIILVGACASDPPVDQSTISVNTPVLVGKPHDVRLTIHNDRDSAIAIVPPPGVTGDPVGIEPGAHVVLRGHFYRVTKPADWQEDELFGLLEIADDDGMFLFAQSGETSYLEEAGGNAYTAYLDVGDEGEWRISVRIEKEGLAPGLALAGEVRVSFLPIVFGTISPVAPDAAPEE